MVSLTLAAFSFAAIHLFVSGTGVRDRLVTRMGERAFRGAFALASAGLLAWLIWSYGQVREPIATSLYQYRLAAAAAIFLSFVFATLGVLTPGPTIVGGEALLDREDPARGIHRITRHPFLWGVALWAATHIVFNAAAAHVLFFGTFLVVALAGTVSIDAKRARAHGDRWTRYASVTSNVPFAAIVERRNRLQWRELARWPLAVAVVAFIAFAILHSRFFGVPAF